MNVTNFLNMLRKRIDFSIKSLRENNQEEGFPFIGKAKDRGDIIKFFEIVKSSLRAENIQSKKIIRFIDSISVGNMREALRMFTNFIKSGNTNVDEIFQKHKTSGGYQLAYHQFIKSIIFGEFRYYQQDRSQIMNMFDFDFALTDSHLHNLRILRYLGDRITKSSEIGRGYISIDDLLSIPMEVLIGKDVIIDSLKRLSRFSLVEFDNQSKEDIESASYIKITAAGQYYLKYLIKEFVYLDSILFDTPISNEEFYNFAKNKINQHNVIERFEKTKKFVDYLLEFEKDEFKNHPEYIYNEFTNKGFFEDIKTEFIKSEDKIKKVI